MLSQLDFLKHILDEIVFVLKQTSGLTEEAFLKNELLQRAVIRSLEIIGEATKKLPEDFRYQYSEVEWKELAGTRDKLIHHYFGVDYEIVWNIIEMELPKLEISIRDIIDSESK